MVRRERELLVKGWVAAELPKRRRLPQTRPSPKFLFLTKPNQIPPPTPTGEMQAAAAVAPSNLILRPRPPAHLPVPSLSLSLSRPRSASCAALLGSQLRLPAPAPPIACWIAPPPLLHDFDARNRDVSARATAADGVDGGGAKPGSIVPTLQLGALFGLWYLFNIYFNIYNKQVLKVFPYPVTITAFQFAVGTVLIAFMWLFNLHKRPKVTFAQLGAIVPLAVVHTLGNLFTNMSLGKVAVSFTHTIKAMEPFFSVVLSAMFLGEFPTVWVVLSLLPIVGGVGLASLTEASFNWAGFWTAMASNVTNQSRNVLSKKLLIKKEESLDNINLFSIITIMSLLLISPVALVMEGVKFTPTVLQSAGLNLNEIYLRSLLACLCFHAYQQVSYMILARVSPVTHSVGNCVKRVVVIVTSVIFFRTPVSPINSLGTGIALAGVFLYSRVKRIKPKAV